LRFYVGETKLHISKKPTLTVTLSKPRLRRVEGLLFEIAHCLWICSFFCSNF